MLERYGGKPVAWRYLRFQLPSWMVVSVAAMAGVHWGVISSWVGVAAVAIFVVKDVILFPRVWRSYEPHHGSETDRLVGQRVVAQTELTPDGHVRIGAELWRARLRGDADAPRGAAVQVVEVRGFTLVVESVKDEA